MAKIVKSVRTYRFWAHSPSPLGYTFPLMLRDTGYGIWRRGEYLKRRVPDLCAFELVTAGNALFHRRGTTTQVGPGELFVMTPGEQHWFEVGTAGFLHKRHLVVGGVMLRVILRSLDIEGNNHVKLRHPHLVARLQKEAVQAIGRSRAGLDWRLSRLAYDLLLTVSREIRHRTFPDPVLRALEYMDGNIDKNLTLAGIADRAGLSPFHFNRLFRTHCERPPIDYFLHRKMSFAGDLLRGTNLLVKEIAPMVGYEDPLYFSAQFRKHVGTSPRVYRGRVSG